MQPEAKSLKRDILVAGATLACCVGILLALLPLIVTPESDSQASVIGHSVNGRPIICRSFGNGQGGVLFLASIHGSEGAGTPLLGALENHLAENPEIWSGDNVMSIAVANPDGLLSKSRLNSRGVDLNRNFPADNRENRKRYGLDPLSEPESVALHRLIEQRQPRVIVSVHQPLACIDYDGPSETLGLAERMAEQCQLPVKKLGSRPGSLGAWFGETLGRPIITFELPRFTVHDEDKLWQRYGAALLEALE